MFAISLDLLDYRDMVTIIRDVIQDMIDRKMTLEQVREPLTLPRATTFGTAPLQALGPRICLSKRFIRALALNTFRNSSRLGEIE